MFQCIWGQFSPPSDEKQDQIEAWILNRLLISSLFWLGINPHLIRLFPLKRWNEEINHHNFKSVAALIVAGLVYGM